MSRSNRPYKYWRSLLQVGQIWPAAHPAEGLLVGREHSERWLMRFRASALLVVVTFSIGCGGSPTGPAQVSGVCRNYASSVSSTTTTTYTGMSPSVATQDITASYNTASNELADTGTGTYGNGVCRSSFSSSTSYGSLADFVDEVSVIPPKTRWVGQSRTVTNSGPSGPVFCSNNTTVTTKTNSYDSQGRLATSVSTGPRSSVATPPNNDVYTAWDVLGRPTAYRPFEYSAALVQISYDDSARTRSTRYFTSPTTTTETFDSNGNLVRSRRDD